MINWAASPPDTRNTHSLLTSPLAHRLWAFLFLFKLHIAFRKTRRDFRAVQITKLNMCQLSPKVQSISIFALVQCLLQGQSGTVTRLLCNINIKLYYQQSQHGFTLYNIGYSCNSSCRSTECISNIYNCNCENSYYIHLCGIQISLLPTLSIVSYYPIFDLLVMAPFIIMSPKVLEISSCPDGDHLLSSRYVKYIYLYIYVSAER